MKIYSEEESKNNEEFNQKMHQEKEKEKMKETEKEMEKKKETEKEMNEIDQNKIIEKEKNQRFLENSRFMKESQCLNGMNVEILRDFSNYWLKIAQNIQTLYLNSKPGDLFSFIA